MNAISNSAPPIPAATTAGSSAAALASTAADRLQAAAAAATDTAAANIAGAGIAPAAGRPAVGTCVGYAAAGLDDRARDFFVVRDCCGAGGGADSAAEGASRPTRRASLRTGSFVMNSAPARIAAPLGLASIAAARGGGRQELMHAQRCHAYRSPAC